MLLPPWSTYSQYIFTQRAHDRSNTDGYKYLYNALKRYKGKSPFSLENSLEFLSELEEKGRSNYTLNNYIKMIRNICRWQKEDWGFDIAYKKKQRNAPRVLTIPQFKKVLKCHPDRTRDAKRVNVRFDTALETAFVCGLRISELCNLKWDDVRPGSLTIRDTKNNEDRVIPIPQHLFNKLTTLRRLKLHDEWVFGYTQGKLNKDTIRKELHTRLDMADLTGTIKSMHDLRHSFATILAAQDINIMKLKDYLGHKDVSSTQLYVHMNAQHLKTVVDRNPYNKPSFDVIRHEAHEFVERLDQFPFDVELNESEGKIELIIRK